MKLAAAFLLGYFVRLVVDHYILYVEENDGI